MSDMAMIPNGNGNGVMPAIEDIGPPPKPITTAPTPAPQVVNQITNGINVLAGKASADPSAGEAKDYAQAALYLAQTLVVIDPASTADGVPLDHELDLEEIRQDGQERLEEARQAAAAPSTPRTRKVKRTEDGYEMTEG